MRAYERRGGAIPLCGSFGATMAIWTHYFDDRSKCAVTEPEGGRSHNDCRIIVACVQKSAFLERVLQAQKLEKRSVCSVIH